jgi:hypothetical protein
MFFSLLCLLAFPVLAAAQPMCQLAPTDNTGKTCIIMRTSKEAFYGLCGRRLSTAKYLKGGYCEGTPGAGCAVGETCVALGTSGKIECTPAPTLTGSNANATAECILNSCKPNDKCDYVAEDLTAWAVKSELKNTVQTDGKCSDKSICIPAPCAIPLAKRVDCGRLGTTRDACVKNGCCWEQRENGSKTPWCFKTKVDSGLRIGDDEEWGVESVAEANATSVAAGSPSESATATASATRTLNALAAAGLFVAVASL